MISPQAFPRAASQTDGMTLRDYFAAHCPNDLAEIHDEDDLLKITGREQPYDAIEMIDYNAEVEAYLRYKFADAMLKVREK